MTTPIIDWDDPEARLDLISRVGVARYNELLLAHQRASVIETVNGYDIRTVGLIYVVDGLNAESQTIERARQMAAEAPRRRRP
jgi:hypothetical protein